MFLVSLVSLWLTQLLLVCEGAIYILHTQLLLSMMPALDACTGLNDAEDVL